jgi:hypothetical protein
MREENDLEEETSGFMQNASDLFNRTKYREEFPTVRRDFKPWHRPRKQVVRHIQWGSEIAWLLSRKSAEDHSLRYLGLPGLDLLDIRYFYARFCQNGSHRLTFLGFDESAKPGSRYRDALNVSLDEVRRLDNVETASDVVGDDFRLLADKQSLAWSRAKQLGPFDVINVDLCGYMADDDPELDLSYYNAIYQLCVLQSRYASPWSLFISSRMDRGHVADDALAKLLGVLRRNLSSCDEFAAEFVDCFGSLEYDAEHVKLWDPEIFCKSITVALAKWLLGLALSMKDSFSISSIAGYRVRPHASAVDMLSLVVRFEPLDGIGVDPVGLASMAVPEADECMQAAPIPKRVAELMDIDGALRASPRAWREFRDATGELLELARYSSEDYREWADADLARSLARGSSS